jgi:uncharacterized protein (TIGR01370 family)
MIEWVCRVAESARRLRHGMLVVPQNGAQLLDSEVYRTVIDGIGVEDLFTDANQPQKADDTAYILRFLEKLKPDGKPILVIEYGATRNAMLLSVKRARQFGFLLLLTHRELRTLGKGVSPTGELYGSK